MTRKRIAPLHDRSSGSRAEAALYALGSLRGKKKSEFEAHVSEGCAGCALELSDFAAVMESLSLSTSPAAPSTAVRRRLLGSLTNRPQKLSRQKAGTGENDGVLLRQSGLLITRSADMSWQPVAPGISRKLLFVDAERKYNTCLIRAEAGARYPRHRHADVEELLILEGELHVHGVVMRPGDYCRAEALSIHDETFTETGCLLLQRSPWDHIEA